MSTITIPQILALAPCRAYNESNILELFKGKTEVTGQDVLAFEIPNVDKLWLLTEGSFLSLETLSSIKQSVLDNFIDNKEAKEYVEYRDEGSLYQYGPICRYLMKNKNYSREDAVSQVTEFVLTQVKNSL